MLVLDKDLPLIKAFLEREALDFPPTKIGSIENWVMFRVQKIEECFQRIKELGGANYVEIQSLGNAGCEERTLRLSANGFFNWQNGIATIYLCTCGNNSCWGNLDEESFRKNIKTERLVFYDLEQKELGPDGRGQR